MNHAPTASLPQWAEHPMDFLDDLFDDGPSRTVRPARDDDIVGDSPDPNDKIEESVRIAEAKILLTATPASDVTLFQLPLEPQDRFESLHGVIVTDRSRSGYSFALTVGQALGRHIPIQNSMEGLTPLFEQLYQLEEILVLTGTAEGDLFRVTGFHCTGLDRIMGHRFKRISDTTVQSVLNRLIYCAHPASLHRPYRATVLPAAESELRFLYSVIRDSLPSHQQDWAEYSFSLLKSSSREEKNHILRALSYVLNINWRPRPIAVAPREEIRALLDEEFFGMEPVKTRIGEIAAQIRRCGKLPRWGILLNGPAGVGKTSMAKAIARVLNLPLVSIELSTACDGDAISGTSRIYSNAHPGAVLESIWSQAQGDSNCVFLLNELDKAATENTNHTNPSNALLTLVDKLSGFTDNYLETGISTDCMFFVATCNDIDKISKPLQDRFLRIDIEGYGPQEKQQIFRQYTFPRALAAANVSPEEITLTDGLVQTLCHGYATTPGVRDLEQCAERIIGDFLLRTEQDHITAKTYTPEDLVPLFGPTNTLHRTLQHGPGLARAPIISEEQAVVCLVQASQRPGTGQLNLIGFPNQFYKDCARMAYEHAKSSFDLSKTDITLCLPRVAPPTADNFIGCAIYMSIASALTGKPLSPNALFLGSCDLHGNVFWPEATLAPVMQLLQRHNIKTLYGPIGIGTLLSNCGEVTAIESYSADLLFNLF